MRRSVWQVASGSHRVHRIGPRTRFSRATKGMLPPAAPTPTRPPEEAWDLPTIRARQARKPTSRVGRSCAGPGMLGTGALIGDAMLAWQAGPSWAQGHRKGRGDPSRRFKPSGRRSLRLPDDGEPLLRPLLRRVPEGAAASTTTQRSSLGVFAQDFPNQAGGNVVPKNKLLPVPPGQPTPALSAPTT